MDSALQLMLSAFTACMGWFTDLLMQTGGFEVWITGIMITLSFKFILTPIFGQAKSDLAKTSYNAMKRRKEK